MKQSMKQSLKIFAAIAALSTAGAIAGHGALAQQQTEAPAKMMKHHAPQRTISVTGTGEVSAKPDMAMLNFSVEARGDTAGEALSANNRQMNAAMSALKRAGIADKDMQTSGLYLNTVNKRGEDGRWSNEIDYYEARNTLTVKVRDIDETGDVIDTAVKAGINGLGGISFGIENDAELLKEARLEAVKDARAKAALYAAGAGVELGEVLYIAEPGSTVGPQPPMVRMAAAESMDASTKIAAGETAVTARVSIVFSIK